MLRDSAPDPLPDSRYSGVRMLWLKVIFRAAYDWATYKDSSKLQLRKYAESADAWLFHESKVFNSFENICRYVGIDPVRVRARIRTMTKEDAKKIEYLDRTPASPGDDDEAHVEKMTLFLRK